MQEKLESWSKDYEVRRAAVPASAASPRDPRAARPWGRRGGGRRRLPGARRVVVPRWSRLPSECRFGHARVRTAASRRAQHQRFYFSRACGEGGKLEAIRALQ